MSRSFRIATTVALLALLVVGVSSTLAALAPEAKTEEKAAPAAPAAPDADEAAPDDNHQGSEAVEPAAGPTASARAPSDGTGAGLIGFAIASGGDGTGGGRSPTDDEPADSSNVQEQQPGDLTGIGSEATQEALPTETGEEDESDRESEPEDTAPPEPTGTAEATATPERTPTPGPSPTATLAPTSGPNGMVSRVIGPDGGELTSPAGAAVTIPPGALTEDATVTIVPVESTKLPAVANVDFVPNSAFDVSVATATGEPVEQLQQPATLRIDVPQEQWREGILLYRIEGTDATALDGATLSESAVSADTDRFSRFVAGLPGATESDGRDPLPFIIGALGIVAVMMIVVGYVTAQQRRRPRAITPRSRRYR